MSKIIKSPYLGGEDQEIVISIQKIDSPATISDLSSLSPEEMMQHAQREAARLVKDAEEHAQQIRNTIENEWANFKEMQKEQEKEWDLKCQEWKKNAEKQGFNEGYEQGKIEGKETWAAQIVQAREWVNLAQREYGEYLKSAEPVIVQLAIQTAEKLVKEELNHAPDHWKSMVNGLVKEVREFGELKLYIHPNWYEHTVSLKDELKNMLEATASLYIYPDDTLSENGCVIEFPFGKIDATIDKQLDVIKEKLLEQIEAGAYESR